MTMLWLWARQRHVPAVVVGLLSIDVLSVALARVAVRVGPGQPITVQAAVLLPVIASCLIASTTVSPMPEQERTANRHMSRLRLLLLAALLLPTAVVLWLTTATGIGQLGPAATVRNVLGLTGLGLLGVALLGNSFGWLPQCLLTGAAYIGGTGLNGVAHVWAFVLRPDPDASAWSIAIILLLSGVLASLAAQQRATTRAADDL